MATEIVQFRLDEIEADFLRKRGYAPNQAARDALAGLIRRIRFRDNLAVLRANPLPTDFDPAQAIREARQDLERRPP